MNRKCQILWFVEWGSSFFTCLYCLHCVHFLYCLYCLYCLPCLHCLHFLYCLYWLYCLYCDCIVIHCNALWLWFLAQYSAKTETEKGQALNIIGSKLFHIQSTNTHALHSTCIVCVGLREVFGLGDIFGVLCKLQMEQPVCQSRKHTKQSVYPKNSGGKISDCNFGIAQ